MYEYIHEHNKIIILLFERHNLNYFFIFRNNFDSYIMATSFIYFCTILIHIDLVLEHGTILFVNILV